MERSYDEGKISTDEFFREISSRLKLNISFAEFKPIWQNIFRLNRGVKEMILRLKKRYRLFLLSNTNELHFDFVKKKYDVLGLLDDYILSYKVGFSKPHPRIFQEALKKADVL
ncbi:MAG: HAD-IA family hydrolase, partial [Candidatus Margulisbacteria bacterium]|nr:HAD-IA family hydrolase [Candidatus Margulisiibacteriota bacterium]